MFLVPYDATGPSRHCRCNSGDIHSHTHTLLATMRAPRVVSPGRGGPRRQRSRHQALFWRKLHIEEWVFERIRWCDPILWCKLQKLCGEEGG